MGQPPSPLTTDDQTLPSPTTSAVPPTPLQLRTAAARLGRPLTLRLALHLALPLAEVPSIAVRRVDGGLVYRTHRCIAAPDIATTACRLAGLGHVLGDRYLSLDASADPLDWAKTVRSGNAWVVFGPDVLFDGPTIQLSASTDPRVTRVVLARIAEGLGDLPILLPSPYGHLFIDGTPNSLHVSTSS